MSVLNFGSVYELKQFMIEQLAPKYFDLEDVNQYNVGLLGYTTEAMSVFTEESFNAANTMFKEVFITRARFPETIYAKAGILGIDGIAATPAKARATMFIKKEDVLKKGRVENNIITFVLDRDTVIDVADVKYSLDYDIHVIARYNPRDDDYIITAQYDMGEESFISSLTHPFIRTYVTKVNGIEYVALFIDVQQFIRYEHTENLITSNNINFPSVNLTYSDMYAGMDVYYKNPETDTFEKLILKVQGSPPIKQPFVYYEHIDDNTIRLSFSTRDNYFRPSFNSELRAVVYTTTGSKGNFKKYDGNDISVVNSTSDRVDYYGNPILWATIIGSSIGGRDIPSMEELRTAVVEKQATSGAYNTESDLELYFNNRSENLDNMFLKFIKKRDDLVERRFSCFGLFKEKTGDYYQTNTLDLRMTEKDFDVVYDNGNRLVVKPGRLIRYISDSKTTAETVGDLCVQNKDTCNDDFVYSNPYLISMQKKPNSIYYYNTSVNKIIPLDYKYNDITSLYQFIINNVTVQRNALLGEDDYTFSVNLMPNFSVEVSDEGVPIFDKDFKVIISFEESGNDTRAFILDMEDFNTETNVISFKKSIGTTDEISQNSTVILKDIYDVHDGTKGEKSAPMQNAKINVSIIVKEEGFGSRYNPFINIEGLDGYTLVSKYTTETEPVTLVKPMKHIRSRVLFEPYVEVHDDGSITNTYYANIDMVPLVSYDLISDDTKTMEFLSEVDYVYDYIDRLMLTKTNNYVIDIKYYNTYGKSRNFVVNETKDRLDRVNLNFRVQVAFEFGTILENAIRDVQEKIKSYVEDINNKVDSNIELRGYNGIYVSNLIQQIENEFPLVRYMKFKNINEYDSSVQVIENETVNMELLTADLRRSYIPEFLCIRLEDIKVDIL